MVPAPSTNVRAPAWTTASPPFVTTTTSAVSPDASARGPVALRTVVVGASSAAARARDEKSSPTSHEVAVTRTLLTGSAAIVPPLRKVTCSVPGASAKRA